MARRLTANIVLRHPDTGSPVVFEEGDEVPGWAAGLITNEDLFTDAAPSPTPVKEPEGDDPDRDENSDENDVPGAEHDDEDDAPEGDDSAATIPPKTGAGSGAKAWRAYAAAKGFEFDEDVKREEIISALAAENVPTE